MGPSLPSQASGELINESVYIYHKAAHVCFTILHGCMSCQIDMGLLFLSTDWFQSLSDRPSNSPGNFSLRAINATAIRARWTVSVPIMWLSYPEAGMIESNDLVCVDLLLFSLPM